MAQSKWTDTETERLLELKKTLSLSAIGKEMNRSKDSVRHKLKLLRPHGTSKVPMMIKEVKKEQEAKPLRQKEPVSTRDYHPVEYCTNCCAPVSNWGEHILRMSWFGCRRPAA